MSSLLAPPADKQPFDWDKIGSVLYDWIRTELSLPDDHVYWSNQSGPEGGYPRVTMEMTSGPTREGGLDETRMVCDLSAPAGQEIELQYVGPREMTITLNAFVDRSAGGYRRSLNAQSLLARLDASTRKVSAIDRFCTAGLSVIEVLGVTDTSEIVRSEYISRATMDVRFRVTSVLSERTTFIEKVSVSGDFDVDAFDYTEIWDTTA